MSDNLAISLSKEDRRDKDASLWVRLEQEEKEPVAPTKREVATVMDGAFLLEPCENPADMTGDGKARSVWDLHGEDAAAIISDKLVSNFNIPDCDDTSNDGTFSTSLLVFYSHVCTDYTLRVTNGTLGGMEIVTKEIELVVNVNGTSHTLDVPIHCKQCHPTEDKVCLKLDNFSCDQPISSIEGSTINFVDEVDVAKIKYIGEYHKYSLTVPGEENGVVGQCTAFCLYEGLDTDLRIDPPNVDEKNRIKCFYRKGYETPEERKQKCIEDCFEHCAPDADPCRAACIEECTPKCVKRQIAEDLCICDGEVTETYNHDEEIPCPSGVKDGDIIEDDFIRRRYLDCGERDKYNDPEFYEEQCCEPWPFPFEMPPCKTQHSDFIGGAGLSEETIAFYQRNYGEESVSFAAVGTDDGRCGESTLEQELHALDCCDEVPELAWDSENSASEMPPSSSATVCVTGGTFPMEVKVRGNGFWLDHEHTIRDGYVNSHCFGIHTDEDACGACKIYVSDGCSSTTGTVLCTVGYWEEIDNAFADCGPATHEQLTIGYYLTVERVVGSRKTRQVIYSESSYARCTACENGQSNPPVDLCVTPTDYPMELCPTNPETFFYKLSDNYPGSPAACWNPDWVYMNPINLRVFEWSCLP